MRAVILIAGMGTRLEQREPHPKVLLQFGDETLLARHLRILDYCGVGQIDLCLGHRANEIEAELDALGGTDRVTRHFNPEYREGSVVSLHKVRSVFSAGESVVFMDGDVLYDHRLMSRLVFGDAGNRFLMDRAIGDGDDPVRLCLNAGHLVDIHKRPTGEHDTAGEWIGFARFEPDSAKDIADAAHGLVASGWRHAIYEEAFRQVLLTAPPGAFRVEDITDLPWIEIDFPEDLERAHSEILPRLEPLPA